ncbi:hypothetical protein E2C01_018283 [Portunus trituberculatus]|uniref:Uncharacterized protein n=1 Tax=Portunus trituberculatus TaxID=210409 RepID=A0A5B7DU42_PORTR|nr:hypothetical protein [Portunus trituberculatus]
MSMTWLVQCVDVGGGWRAGGADGTTSRSASRRRSQRGPAVRGACQTLSRAAPCLQQCVARSVATTPLFCSSPGTCRRRTCFPPDCMQCAVLQAYGKVFTVLCVVLCFVLVTYVLHYSHSEGSLMNDESTYHTLNKRQTGAAEKAKPSNTDYKCVHTGRITREREREKKILEAD